MKFRMTILNLLFLVATVLRTGAAAADEVKYLPQPLDSISAIVTSIHEAKSSIDMAYFLFEPCQPSAWVILEVLKQKARSGVRVRLLLDAISYSPEFRARLAEDLRQAGAELRLYNPQPLIAPLNNYRMHVKLLLIDNSYYISGGRNLADEYFGFDSDFNYLDRDVLVRGSSVQHAVNSFHELWNSKLTKRPRSLDNIPAWGVVCASMERGGGHGAQDLINYIFSAGARSLHRRETHSCPNVRFVTDNPVFMDQNPRQSGEIAMTGAVLREKRTTSAVLNFINGTRQKLEVENWSYIPDGLIDTAFKSLRDRNIPILVFTNRDGDNDGAIGEVGAHLNRHFARRDTRGSQLVIQLPSNGHLRAAHDMTPRQSRFRVHFKTALRDQRDVLVSSFNIDPRSYHTNLESAVVIEDCPSLAAELNQESANLVRAWNNDVAHGYVTPSQPTSFTTSVLALFGFPFF